MTIWKFQLALTGLQTVQMPEGAQILDVQSQDRSICLWALCHETAPMEDRVFNIVGTGRPISENPGKHLGTVQSGIFVWHVFEDMR